MILQNRATYAWISQEFVVRLEFKGFYSSLGTHSIQRTKSLRGWMDIRNKRLKYSSASVEVIPPHCYYIILLLLLESGKYNEIQLFRSS